MKSRENCAQAVIVLLYTTHISVFKLSEVFAYGSGVGGGGDVWNSEMIVNSGERIKSSVGSCLSIGRGPWARQPTVPDPVASIVCGGTRWHAAKPSMALANVCDDKLVNRDGRLLAVSGGEE